MNDDFSIVIMAAGKGTRMLSDKPKVLMQCGGKPIIQRVVDAATGAGCKDITVVVGYQQELVQQALAGYEITFVVDDEVNGTGLSAFKGLQVVRNKQAMVINGDHPLITANVILRILDDFKNGKYDSAVVTWQIPDAGRYGRIVRDNNGSLDRIVEAADCSQEELKIKEYNVGTYVLRKDIAIEYLKSAIAAKSQGEHYITDIFKLMVDDGFNIGCILGEENFATGVNTPEELSRADLIAQNLDQAP